MTMRHDLIPYYTLIPVLTGYAPSPLFAQASKGELRVSANKRLSGLSAQAHIESRELAEQFAQHCRPVFIKRYGQGTDVEVVAVEETASPRLKDRIMKDSAAVRAQLGKKDTSK